MQSAKEEKYFPYDSRTTCYILVYLDGTTKQIQHNKVDQMEAFSAVSSKKASLYAVWPGQYRSDLFIIDDINKFADIFGIPRQDDHIHKVKWELSAFDDGVSRYADVKCRLDCGCSIEELGIRKFALDMKSQKGWVVATSKGYGYAEGSFVVPITRASLKIKK